MHCWASADRSSMPSAYSLIRRSVTSIGRDTLDVDQRLKITSLTFLFTDLKGSTELYDRVGDLVAYDLVRAHFRLLNDIIAAEAGAVVKTNGDAVMATFPTPDRAVVGRLTHARRDARDQARRPGPPAQDRHA